MAEPRQSHETGRVVAVAEDALWVETIRRSTCGSCSVQQACGHGLLNRLFNDRQQYLRLPYQPAQHGAYAVGDTVSFTIADRVLLRAAAIAYLMPLVLLLTGGVVASQFSSADAAAVAGSVGGFLTGLLLLRWHAAHFRDDPGHQPRLLAAQSIAPTAVIR